MNLMRKIAVLISVPLSVVMLVLGTSYVTGSRQRSIEEQLEKDLAQEFVPVFRMAVASDVHINLNNPRTTDRFEKLFQTAYRYSDAHPSYNSLDAVLVVGDIADSGAENQYEVINRVVSGNIRPETVFIPVMGNHEFGEGGRERFAERMNEPLELHKVVKGFHIIGMAPSPSDTWHTPSQLLWMDRELRSAEAEDPQKPIFTAQHGHIWNTVYVSRSWKTQMSLPLHAVYSKYPQIVNFSGHSHGPINNPLDVWQNSYTQVGTGTLNYFEMEKDIGDETVPAGAENAAQYLIVEVDAENRVRIQPYNILTEDFFKTPSTTDDPDKQLVFQISAPTDRLHYAYTSSRKALATKPWFEKDAALTVSEAADSVTFDQAEDNVCVYGYRITVRDTEGLKKKVYEKEIYSGYYFEPMPETCTCPLADLESGKTYTVSVAPLNVWLQEGEPLTATFTVK